MTVARPWEEARRGLTGLPDGGLNIAFEAVDRHVDAGFGERIAIRCRRRNGRRDEMSYAALKTASDRFAGALARLGVGAGATVSTLTPRVAALPIVALGTWKVRAVFSALFPSFGPEPIVTRLAKGKARVLVTTADLYHRKVRPIRDRLPKLAHVLLIDGANDACTSFDAVLAAATPLARIPPTAPEDIAFIHFTSGTTGAPKGVVHVHEAVVAIAASARAVLGLAPGRIYWCTADPGWITGVCYGLIAPLVAGATAILDEDEFDAVRWYRLLAEERVASWYTAPTALRMLKRAGIDLARRHDLPALDVIASVGEPLNPEVVRWGQAAFRRDIRDTWWQTETGAIMIASGVGETVVPGAMGRPLPGIEAAIVRRAGSRLEIIEAPDVAGELALRRPWPSMFRAYLDDPDRYARAFRDQWYLTGDVVRRDGAGLFHFIGRADDMIKSAAHLIGPFEVENVLLEHRAVAEAAVIGIPDAVIGETVKAFVTLQPGYHADASLVSDLLAHARRRLGPALAPRTIAVRPSLPKTRSGKILRRLVKAQELGLPEGDLSTLED